MRFADIFVLFSRWEGFGNVLVEAMAIGSPVVFTDCPHGPAEIIDDGNTVLLVPPADPMALAAAMQWLIITPTMRQRIGEAGQRRAQHFSAERVRAAYAAQFRAMVAVASA